MTISSAFQDLEANIISQARFYLQEVEEFFPFGAVIDTKNILHPISVYWGEENPSSQEVFDRLKQAIEIGIKDKQYICGAIGMDVWINVDQGKKTALSINFFSRIETDQHYFAYRKRNKEYIFERI